MQKLVLVRHGQSQWNLENRFTGWVDVPLTEKGLQEAQLAGERIKSAGLQFEAAYTSYLQRAIRTLWTILETTDQAWISVHKHWRLNERHYGGLQGLNKQETRDKYGEEQVFEWRRSYATPPPEATEETLKSQSLERRYQGFDLPKGEALKQTLERVEPYWYSHILPELKKGGNILVAAHGNSLRSLFKLLTGMDETDITQFEFATGVPLVCHLTEDFKVSEYHWLNSN